MISGSFQHIIQPDNQWCSSLLSMQTRPLEKNVCNEIFVPQAHGFHSSLSNKKKGFCACSILHFVILLKRLQRHQFYWSGGPLHFAPYSYSQPEYYQTESVLNVVQQSTFEEEQCWGFRGCPLSTVSCCVFSLECLLYDSPKNFELRGFCFFLFKTCLCNFTARWEKISLCNPNFVWSRMLKIKAAIFYVLFHLLFLVIKRFPSS